MVINPPQKPPEPLAQKFPKILWLSSPKGANLARRMGIRQALAPWIWLLDDDVELPTCEKIKNGLQHRLSPDVQVLGGPYLFPASVSILQLFYVLQARSYQQAILGKGMTFLFTGNLLFHRSVPIADWLGTSFAVGGDELQLNAQMHTSGVAASFSDELGVFHSPNIPHPFILFKIAFLQGRASVVRLHLASQRLFRTAQIWNFLELEPTYLKSSQVSKKILLILFKGFGLAFHFGREWAHKRQRFI